jgi:transmembrane sensor
VSRIKLLILKHLRDESSDAEQIELEVWLALSKENRELFNEINDSKSVAASLSKIDQLHENEVWEELLAYSAKQKKYDKPTEIPIPSVHLVRRTRWWAAAAILILATTGGYLWINRPQKELVKTADWHPAEHDIAPGGNKAILTLANGQNIILDSVHNGKLSLQGNASVNKTNSDKLVYISMEDSTGTDLVYNILTTPRGGQYQIVLQDGTNAWLNAASSITYPTTFTGKERKVEITGEVYFEVAKNMNMPFKVVLPGNEEVEVLGTHFNINAYNDEVAVKTTLLEGSVKVIKDKTTTLLVPGQQAQFLNFTSDAGSMKVVKNADLEEVMAWKNGSFRLTSTDIPTIMRQVARWYDVEIVYEKGVPPGHITGEVPRNTSLSKVLDVFETSGVHFSIEGKKIIIKP